ncbi:MAG: type VII secretion protein EccB [Microbacteriaceae bacterium]
MATKKDLIEAQGFSRRRLLSAFTSGAPGGKELDPAKPLRAVAGGIALTAILILGGLFFSFLRPGLPSGWENNTLVLVSDTGARYLSIGKVLYPVINTASARLMVASDDFRVITTDQESLAGISIGAPIGILGAPDTLPATASLVNEGWVSCVSGANSSVVSISPTPIARPSDSGVLVTLDDRSYVVTGGYRYEIADEGSESVLRAVGLAGVSAIEVDDQWLNLFEPGTTIAPLVVRGAGDTIAGSELTVGTVVHPTGSETDNRYLVTDRGDLARISPLAYGLWQLGSGALLDGERDVSPAEIASLNTAQTVAGGSDWPQVVLRPTPANSTMCAVLERDETGAPSTSFATLAGAKTLPKTSVAVSSGAGALVITGGSDTDGGGLVVLVDGSGTAFPIPGANAETIARLGYSEKNIGRVPAAWLQFLAAGPELTEEAAGASPQLAISSGTK